MSHKTLLLEATVLVALTSACQSPTRADPRMVSEWMHTYYGAIRVERLSPPVASRLMAYASTALYSGLAAAIPSLAPLTKELNGVPEFPRAVAGERIDPTVAAVAAGASRSSQRPSHRASAVPK